MDQRERNKRSGWEAPTIHAIDYSRRPELFETACKVFAVPMEVRHVWGRIRFFSLFRATLTSWLYTLTKDHMKKHQKECRQFVAEIGPEAFKKPLLTHRNAKTTGWKRAGKVSIDNTKARESILERDLAKKVCLSLHNSFCLNRESKVKSLPNQTKRDCKSKGNRCEPTNNWRISLSAPTIKKNYRGKLLCRVHLDPVPRKWGARTEQGAQTLVLESWAWKAKRGLSVKSDETWGHGKEILMYKILLLIYYIYYTNQNAAWQFFDWIGQKKFDEMLIKAEFRVQINAVFDCY